MQYTKPDLTPSVSSNIGSIKREIFSYPSIYENYKAVISFVEQLSEENLQSQLFIYSALQNFKRMFNQRNKKHAQLLSNLGLFIQTLANIFGNYLASDLNYPALFLNSNYPLYNLNAINDMISLLSLRKIRIINSDNFWSCYLGIKNYLFLITHNLDRFNLLTDRNYNRIISSFSQDNKNNFVLFSSLVDHFANSEFVFNQINLKNFLHLLNPDAMIEVRKNLIVLNLIFSYTNGQLKNRIIDLYNKISQLPSAPIFLKTFLNLCQLNTRIFDKEFDVLSLVYDICAKKFGEDEFLQFDQLLQYLSRVVSVFDRELVLEFYLLSLIDPDRDLISEFSDSEKIDSLLRIFSGNAELYSLAMQKKQLSFKNLSTLISLQKLELLQQLFDQNTPERPVPPAAEASAKPRPQSVAVLAHPQPQSAAVPAKPWPQSVAVPAQPWPQSAASPVFLPAAPTPSLTPAAEVNAVANDEVNIADAQKLLLLLKQVGILNVSGTPDTPISQDPRPNQFGQLR